MGADVLSALRNLLQAAGDGSEFCGTYSGPGASGGVSTGAGAELGDVRVEDEIDALKQDRMVDHRVARAPPQLSVAEYQLDAFALAVDAAFLDPADEEFLLREARLRAAGGHSAPPRSG